MTRYIHTPSFFRACAQTLPSCSFDLDGEGLAHATDWPKTTAIQKAEGIGVYPEAHMRFGGSSSLFRITAAQIVSIQKEV